MPRRVWFLVVILTGGVVLAALGRPFVYDFARYEVLDGFAASRWTWLALAAGIAVALAGVLTPRWRLVGAANLIAGLAVAGTLAFTVHTTKGREEPPGQDHTCREGDNPLAPLGCAVDKALSVLDGKPPPSKPRRWFVELALGAYVVASGAAAMRREA